MTVDLQENLLPEEQYEQADDTVYDIVAAKDGVITEMITRSGTPCVTAGAEVKKGDLLVGGSLPVLNDDGEVAQYLYRSADADITARVVYTYEDEIPETYVKKVPTGNQKTDYQLTVMNYTIKNPFFHTKEGLYEIVTDMKQLHMTDNFYLPVYLV